MTTTVGAAAEVELDAAALTRCRRRVHLDHDPAAAASPRALPDPALEQRRADAAVHRTSIGAAIAAATGGTVVAAGSGRERVVATAEAIGAGAPVIVGGMVPGVDGGRPEPVELLVALPGGGYVPVLIVRHRVSDPGAGAVTSSLRQPWPAGAGPDDARRIRSQPRDLLRLAHLHRFMRAAGWTAPAAVHAAWGGVIGLDADVVVWHDLAAGHWPGGRSTFTEYDVRLADRTAVATAAATGAAALAQPSRITECRHCPWWPTCEGALLRVQDVSLVVRGEVAAALRESGVHTVAQLAALEPTAPSLVQGVPLADPIVLARAWLRGLSVVRRVPTVVVQRADVEVDVDMESFGEAGAYLWGALLRHPGGMRPGDEPAGYRSFATWEPVPTSDEARSFAAFWGWFSGVRAQAAATGRTFAAYCYNAQAENRWLLGSARRFVGLPGIPSLAEVTAFTTDPCWVDLFAVVNDWFLCAHGKGLKRIAPAAGFAWRDAEAGGENSMRWYRDAVGMDGAPPDPVQRQRLLDYNADDVAATAVLRDWMTSAGIEEVPLAAQL